MRSPADKSTWQQAVDDLIFERARFETMKTTYFEVTGVRYPDRFTPDSLDADEGLYMMLVQLEEDVREGLLNVRKVWTEWRQNLKGGVR